MIQPQRQRSGPKPRQHPSERLVDAVKERFKRDVVKIKDFLTVDGRPVFTQKLSPLDELVRFYDDTTRNEIIADLDRRQGPDAVRAYYERMAKLSEEYRQALFGAALDAYSGRTGGRTPNVSTRSTGAGGGNSGY